MFNYGFMLSVLLHCFSVGCREGFTWATDINRINNKLIKHKDGKGIFGYHKMRVLEMFSIWGMITTYSSMFDLIYIPMLFPVYELLEIHITRFHLSFKEIFHLQKYDWSWGNKSIKRVNYKIKYFISLICVIIVLYFN